MSRTICVLTIDDNQKLHALKEIALMKDPLQVMGFSTPEWEEVRKFYRELGFKYKFPVEAVSITANGEVRLDEVSDLK